jgi:predicted CoA-binding protein|tara:strand:- start:980 stop:1381 length:402 start_codon:yes stop_codon:yes gene_type:complete
LSNSNKDILKELLKNIKNIAIVGASSNPKRDSFKVMKFLLEQGYEIFPVNPKEINILGRKCYSSLTSIEERVDMVDIFRSKEFVFGLTKEAIKINANIIWMQEGIIDKKSSSLGIKNGLKVIMDECPKKVLTS